MYTFKWVPVKTAKIDRTDLIFLSIYFFYTYCHSSMYLFQKYILLGLSSYFVVNSLEYPQEPAIFIFCILQHKSIFIVKTSGNTDNTRESHYLYVTTVNIFSDSFLGILLYTLSLTFKKTSQIPRLLNKHHFLICFLIFISNILRLISLEGENLIWGRLEIEAI